MRKLYKNEFKGLITISITQYDWIYDSHHTAVLNLVWFSWSDLSLMLSQFSLSANINSPLYRNTYYSLKIKHLDLYDVTYITHFPFYRTNLVLSLWATNLVSSTHALPCITERFRQQRLSYRRWQCVKTCECVLSRQHDVKCISLDNTFFN